MGVSGATEISAAFRRIREGMRSRIVDVLDDGGVIILSDMKALTPEDPANPGAHAADGLTIVRQEDGLKVSVGLPTRELVNDFFWFRFLDGGTAGGEVVYRRNGKRFTMKVPARAALHIRARARDQNIEEIRQALRDAVAEGLTVR